MSMANRIELAPLYLIATDLVIACCAAVAVLPLGIAAALAPVCVVLAVYAGGGYSLVSEVTLRRSTGVILASIMFMIICCAALLLPHPLWALPWAWQARIGAAALGCIAFAGAHSGLEGYLRRRSQGFILHMRPDMREAGEALQRHLSRSGYPAELAFDEPRNAPPDRLRAEILHPRKDLEEDPDTLEVRYDPAHFCDVALKVLPPAVLACRGDYVRWERHERRVYDDVKRGIDALAASLLALLSLPVMAMAAVGIALSDGRPVLFRQTRVGRYGKRFSVLKFRTLRASTRRTATPNDGIEARAFRFGSFLRRTRVDELPQFINIMRGDMSLIGPRPEMEFFHERCVGTIPFYRKRLLVRPGLTGWAQTRFTHTTTDMDYWDKTAYDLWYIKHRSIVIDMRIVLRTAGVMLFGIGAR
jgi:lipopolysaccharide/colanic/teichoic acid biosynthesis glycosyltransferase